MTQRLEVSSCAWRIPLGTPDARSLMALPSTPPGPLPLQGRRALVTGASRGIGRAVACALGAAGAHVHLLARTAAALEEVARDIGSATVHVGDMTDAIAMHQVLATLEADGRYPDILVSSAGVFPLAAVAETEPAVFERTLLTNLIGPFRLLHGVLPRLKASGRGDIVTIGSVADRRIFGGNGAYAASKFGARALHEVLRTELAGSGVRCTLVSPAATDTPIWDPIDPDNTPGFPARTAMLRPADVADAVLWALTRPPHVNIDELRVSRT